MSITKTDSSDTTESGAKVMLLRVKLKGRGSLNLQFNNYEGTKFVTPEPHDYYDKPLPFSFSKQDNSIAIINNGREECETTFLVYYTKEGEITNNQLPEIIKQEPEKYDSLRKTYSKQQGVESISHDKQILCMDLVVKFLESYDYEKMSILYIGPDNLLNLETTLQRILEQINPDKITLDLASTKVTESEYSDSMSFIDNKILDVTINKRIPHGKEELMTDYDLIIDCYTYPAWPNEKNDTPRKDIFRLWEEKLTSNRGSYIFITPKDLQNEIFFNRDVELSYETEMEEAFGDFTSNTVVKPDKYPDIYAILLNFGGDEASKTDNLEKIAHNILRIKPLIKKLEETISIGKDTLPKIRDSKNKEIDLNDLLNHEYPTIIVHGQGGIGKSTSAKWLAAKSIRDGRFPLMIKGDDLTRIGTMDRNEILKLSFTNLCYLSNHDSSKLYYELEIKELVILVDQLDDIDKDEYPKLVSDLIDHEIPKYYDGDVKTILFAREDNYFEEAFSCEITTDLQEIKSLLKSHKVDINDEVEQKLKDIINEGHNLVRADIPYLVDFLTKGETFTFSNYGKFKSYFIPKLIFDEEGIPTKHSKCVIPAIIALLYSKGEPVSLSRIVEGVKRLIPDEDEKPNSVKNIIVASRLFVEKAEDWKIDAHDSVRDSFAAQFYEDEKNLDFFCKEELHHPLHINRLNNEKHKSLNRRIISKIAENKFDAEKEVYSGILDIAARICKDSKYEEKKIIFDTYLSQSNDSEDYEIGLESCKFKDDSLFEIGIKLWKFFGFYEDNLKDTQRFVELMFMHSSNKSIKEMKEQNENNNNKSEISALFRRYEISPELYHDKLKNI